MTPETRAELLRQIWWAGVGAVRGDSAVSRSLQDTPISRPDLILAVGKAAVAMAKAAQRQFDVPTLLALTKHGHSEPGLPFPVVESAHPVPDASSLAAGAHLLATVAAAPPGSHLLLLVSGGASALVEVPRPGVTLADIAALNRDLLASGQDIATMNATRTRFSAIKGGGLVAAFKGARVTVLAVSDTAGDRIETIGSGIGLALPRPGLTVDSRIVASNAVARAAAAAKARALGLAVLHDAESLYDDVAACADLMAHDLPDRPGLAIWGASRPSSCRPTRGRAGAIRRWPCVWRG